MGSGGGGEGGSVGGGVEGWSVAGCLEGWSVPGCGDAPLVKRQQVPPLAARPSEWEVYQQLPSAMSLLKCNAALHASQILRSARFAQHCVARQQTDPHATPRTCQ